MMRKAARCLGDDLDPKKAYSIIRIGLRAIPVKKIVGTVDKCGEVDHCFKPLRRSDIGELLRRERIHRKTNPWDFLPPISVIRYAGIYYVLDGHRRVASVKKRRIDFIDAEIDEYIIQGDSKAIEGRSSRLRFQTETGISSISLNQEENFEYLLSESRCFITPDDWARDCYFPLVRAISKSPLMEHYRGLLEGDIYVLISGFYRETLGRIPDKIRPETLITGFLAAHKVPHYKPFRLPFAGFLLRLFGLG
jgi:hypothetical protein